ncbi:MAG: glycosyltransferase family 4 protein [Desulfobacteraceae bacterium]|nr:glycosyltransferase family 4 protein [Desulfobacteraceae bacterium]
MKDSRYNILSFSSFGDMKGGGQESLFQLVKNLNKGVFRPVIVVPEYGELAEKVQSENIPVVKISLPAVLNPRIYEKLIALRNLAKIIKQYKIDLIHTDGPRNTFYGGILSKLCGKPLIWHIRVSDKDKYDRILYHLSTKLILVANALKNRFDWDDRSQKMVTIYNGIDFSEFTPNNFKFEIREVYGIKNNSLIIITVARIERLKGQKYLIEACGRLKEKIQNFHVLLVGEIAESDYFRECNDLSDKLGIRDRITFTGRENRVNQILSESDLFVLPSLSEAFPRSLLEAMAVGKPVIVTDVGGCSEAVVNEESGYIVPPKESELLAEKIFMMLANKELRHNTGRASAVRARSLFDIKETVKQTEKVFTETIVKYNKAKAQCN